MSNKRNLGIIGAPDSGVTELFEAFLRLGKTPKPKNENYWSGDGLTDWTQSNSNPYNSKLREKMLKP